MTDPITFVADFARATVALFIIIDPLGTVPILMSLTEKMDRHERRRAFNLATVIGLALLIIFSLVGQQLLLLFNISLQSFMVAGGILLLILAMRILIYGEWEVKTFTPEEIGVVPIAFPLLVGPGAMTTILVTLQSSGILVAILATVTVTFITWLVLRFVDPLFKLLGKLGSLIISKIMSVFIAAIAVQFIVEGLRSIL